MNNLKLIDGTFSISDARALLLSLIDDKVRYHKHRIFSHEERFGTTDQHSEQRIIELQLARKELLDDLNKLSGDTVLEINSSISIEITAKTIA